MSPQVTVPALPAVQPDMVPRLDRPRSDRPAQKRPSVPLPKTPTDVTSEGSVAALARESGLEERSEVRSGAWYGDVPGADEEVSEIDLPFSEPKYDGSGRPPRTPAVDTATDAGEEPTRPSSMPAFGASAHIDAVHTAAANAEMAKDAPQSDGPARAYDDPWLDSATAPPASPSADIDLRQLERWGLPDVPRPPTTPPGRRFPTDRPPVMESGARKQDSPALSTEQALGQAPSKGVSSPLGSAAAARAAVPSPQNDAVNAARALATEDGTRAYGGSPWARRLLWGGLASAVVAVGLFFVWPLWETIAPVEVPPVAKRTPPVAAAPPIPADIVTDVPMGEAAAPSAPPADLTTVPAAEVGAPEVANAAPPVGAEPAGEAAPSEAVPGEAVAEGAVAPSAPQPADETEAPAERSAAVPTSGQAEEDLLDDSDLEAAVAPADEAATAPVQDEPTTANAAAAAAGGLDLRRAPPGKLLARGRELLGAGRPADAEVVLRALLARRPRDHHIIKELIEALLDQQRGGEAVGMARFIVQKRARRAPYHVLLGRTLLAAGKRAEADAAFRRALSLDPKSRGARHFLNQP